jgi:hypothetical protein
MNRFAWILIVVPGGVFAACSSSSSSSGGGADGGASETGTDTDSGGAVDASGAQCTSARKAALVPIAKVATGEVTVLSESGGTKKIYVDASAGGLGGATKNPRVYVNLETGTKVAVNDDESFTSTAWDLALKRVVIFTNSGDGGPGAGGAAALTKPFAQVTAADADAAKIKAESFFDENCELKKDALGGPATTFAEPPPYGWYDYDQATSIPTPRQDVTYIVKGGTGKRYKLAIRSYDALPDGGSRGNVSTGYFVLEVAAL